MANFSIKGEYLNHGSYTFFKDTSTGVGLEELLDKVFPKGVVVELSISGTYIDTMPKCHEKNKYNYECGEILDDAGDCPNVDNHFKEAEVTA